MKRIIIFLIVFVNLKISMKHGYLHIGIQESVAQSMRYETLPEVVITGKTYVSCPDCNERILLDDMTEHQKVCPEAYILCPTCGESVKRKQITDGTHHCEEQNQNSTQSDGGTGGSSGGGGGSGSSGTSSGNNNSGYSLSSVLGWTKDLYKGISDIINDLLKNGKIIDVENGHCYYDRNDGKIKFSKGFGSSAISHEIIHYVQDCHGILDEKKNGADNEYQAYVLNYILLTASGVTGAEQPGGLDGWEIWNTFRDFLGNHCGKNSDNTLWYDQMFISSLNSLDNETLSLFFRNYYKSLDELNKTTIRAVYYEHHDPNYKFFWEDLLNQLGFKLKK